MPIPTEVPRKQAQIPSTHPLPTCISVDNLTRLFQELIEPNRVLSPAQKRLAEYVMDAAAPTAESSLALYGSGRR